jgi:glycerophosphoryl diester phosphodiesterase
MTAIFRDILRSRRFLNGAHRGASAYAPENTLPAFELAIAQGAAVLEIDVRLTQDEEVVVIHDARVDRTTDGQGEVRLMTLSDIRSLDAGSWFGQSWTGARVPTLSEILEQLAGRVLIDVDMKGGTEVRSHASSAHCWPSSVARDQAGGEPAPPRVVVEDPTVSTLLARKTLEGAARAGALDRVVLSGFGLHALAWIRRAEPRVLTQWAVVSADIAEDAARAAAEGFEVLSPQMNAATRANMARAHDEGLAVFLYAPDDTETLARLIDIGADAVHVDRPDRLSAWLKDRQPRGR